MTRATFFKHFELLADQPDAVVKMRELVLQLAIRGQIVEQIAADQKDGAWQKFLKSVDGKDDGDELPPFDIPKDWRWVRLDDVADYSAARKVEPSEISDKAWVLDLEEIEKDTGRLLRVTTFKEKQSSSNKAEFLPGDVLYGKLRPYLNKVLVAPKAGFCTTEIVPIRSRGMIVPTYLCLFLRSPHFVAYTNSKSYGMKMPRLGTEDAVQAWIAVPPPAEQRRIVAKVDELMALCDELEQRQQARQHASGLLQQSALHHLLAAREPHAFAPAWQRVRDHFHLLHDTPDAIPQLRQAILQLAVQGRLVPQNPKDEPAAELLHRIGAPWKLSKDQGASLAVSFGLPTGWVWARCVELCNPRRAITYGVIKLGSPVSNGVPVLRSSNVRPLFLDTSAVKCIAPEIANEFARTFLEGGEILVTVRGTLGGVAVTPASLKGANISREVAMIPLLSELDAQFFTFVIASPMGQAWLTGVTKGIAYAGINIKDLKELPIAVPPLAEQKRIVARVEELLRWCDTLEAQLHQTRTLGAHLLASTLHHLLAA